MPFDLFLASGQKYGSRHSRRKQQRTLFFYSSIPLIYRKFAYFLDDIIDGNRFINDELPKKGSGLSPVSISVGVAFTDRKKSSRFIFKDPDKALYLVKENSRRGCAIY